MSEHRRPEGAPHVDVAEARALIEHARSALALITPDGRLLLCNHAFRSLLPLERAVSDGEAVWTLLPDGERLAQGLSVHDSSIARHLRLSRSDGSTVDLEVTAARWQDGRGDTVLLVELRDITEELRLKAQLLELQHGEAAATSVVPGLVHDFRNLLMMISGHLELGSIERGNDEWLVQARVATERAAALAGQLLRVLRRGRPVYHAVDLGELARETLALAGAIFDERIALALEVRGPGPVVARGDRSQLQRVLVNLLLNARDAVEERMPAAEGGPESGGPQPRIAVVVERVPPQPGAPARVRMVVEDNGAGMTSEVRERIFEPFYTTKREAGTGLGLSAAQGIVREHGGTIAAASEPGAGSRFAVTLPPADPKDALRSHAESLTIEDLLGRAAGRSSE